MTQPTINPISKKMIDAAASSRPQAVLIAGPRGIGHVKAAEYLAAGMECDVIHMMPEKDNQIDMENGIISVDMIRRLQSDTRGKSVRNTAIIISNTDNMNVEAQNAFLKLLEEPRNGLFFILTTDTPGALLPTIRSRVHIIDLLPITDDQSLGLLESLGENSPARIKQLLFLARGLPEEIIKLASDDDYFQGRAALLKEARLLLQSTDTYEKLIIITKYKSDRLSALDLLDFMLLLLHKTINQSKNPSLADKLSNLLDVRSRIARNGNIQLQLTAAML